MQRKKNPSSLQSTDSEKNRNNLQKYIVLTKNTKNGNFWRFFLIFSVTILLKEMGSFALRSVYQNASFELSNTAFGQFLKFSPLGEQGVRNLKEKLFRNQHDKTNTKFGGRSLMDKFGLYGSPLQYST